MSRYSVDTVDSLDIIYTQISDPRQCLYTADTTETGCWWDGAMPRIVGGQSAKYKLNSLLYGLIFYADPLAYRDERLFGVHAAIIHVSNVR